MRTGTPLIHRRASPLLCLHNGAGDGESLLLPRRKGERTAVPPSERWQGGVTWFGRAGEDAEHRSGLVL